MIFQDISAMGDSFHGFMRTPVLPKFICFTDCPFLDSKRIRRIILDFQVCLEQFEPRSLLELLQPEDE